MPICPSGNNTSPGGPISLTSITDGTSNTAIFSEVMKGRNATAGLGRHHLQAELDHGVWLR